MPPARVSVAPAASRALALAALLGVLAAELLSGVGRDALTTDESIYIAAGFQHLATGDYRPNPETPPLAKLLGAAPLFALAPVVPARRTGETDAQWAERFLVRANDTGRLLSRARWPNVALSLLLAAGLWAWARAAYGARAGWTALVLAVFHPALPGHGHLATTDVAAAAAMLACSAAFAAWSRRPGAGRAALVGAAFGVAVATRLTAGVLLPAFGVWLSLRAWRLPATERAGWLRSALGLLLAGTSVAAVVVWGAYRFRCAPSPTGAPFTHTSDAGLGGAGRALAWIDRARLLPEAYVEAWRFQMEHQRRGHPAFFAGDHARTGWRGYYVVTFLVKNTPGFLLATLTATLLFVRRRPAWDSLETQWLLPAALTFIALSLGSVQLGDRYLLPVYAYLILLIASRAPELLARPRGAALGALVVAWHAGPALLAVPGGQLAYFNALAGGTAGAHRLLLDSNLDWGQDLPRVGEWMRAHGVHEVQLGYIGPDAPERFGIRHRDLPGRHACTSAPAGTPFRGVVAVSPNVLFNLLGRAPDPYAELARRPPDDRAGVFFIYRLGDGENGGAGLARVQ